MTKLKTLTCISLLFIGMLLLVFSFLFFHSTWLNYNLLHGNDIEALNKCLYIRELDCDPREWKRILFLGGIAFLTSIFSLLGSYKLFRLKIKPLKSEKKIFSLNHLLIAANIIGLISLLGILDYTIENKSGHTAANPYMFLNIFVPLLILGVTFYKWVQPHKWPAIISFVLGVAGIAFLVYLDKANILLQYSVWIERGMPAPKPLGTW